MIYILQTTDWTLQNSVLLSDTIMMTGFPHTYTKEQIKEKLPAKYKHSVSQVCVHCRIYWIWLTIISIEAASKK